MSSILAIETATSSCSVALGHNDDVFVRNQVGNNIHSQVLLDMIDSVLLQAKLEAMALTAIAVGQGPGSFTGLRIGVGVGQGMAFGAKCPMIGVSSLDALALQASGDGAVIAAIDARMGEVYWCEYLKTGQRIIRQGGLQVTTPEQVCFSSHKNMVLVGNAWSVYRERFSALSEYEIDVQTLIVYPSAQALLSLAKQEYVQRNVVSAAEFVPIYVRDDVAKKSTKPIPGRRPT